MPSEGAPGCTIRVSTIPSPLRSTSPESSLFFCCFHSELLRHINDDEGGDGRDRSVSPVVCYRRRCGRFAVGIVCDRSLPLSDLSRCLLPPQVGKVCCWHCLWLFLGTALRKSLRPLTRCRRLQNSVLRPLTQWGCLQNLFSLTCAPSRPPLFLSLHDHPGAPS